MREENGYIAEIPNIYVNNVITEMLAKVIAVGLD